MQRTMAVHTRCTMTAVQEYARDVRHLTAALEATRRLTAAHDASRVSDAFASPDGRHLNSEIPPPSVVC